MKRDGDDSMEHSQVVSLLDISIRLGHKKAR